MLKKYSDLTFSRNLKELRKKRGYSQDKLAQLVNKQTGKDFGRTTISNYETGTSSPSLDIIAVIAKILDVSTGDLLDETDGNPNGNLIDESKTEKYGSDTVSLDIIEGKAAHYIREQDEFILKLKGRLREMEDVVESKDADMAKEMLKEALLLLMDLTDKYHTTSGKYINAFQKYHRLANMIKDDLKL
ncbi:helix-turn-helix transcriptional regulator [Fulvivirga sp. 29W222]|uniref:Helix-turn-helix transcriptional regulator n=1 Tax=Fulvivirga marina TaxID=2494733 RepID=A0A937FW17_9BACT|nr:helix-turn-helix transcriptional regulator [Fulvivirga marina]MBL6445356.1 helix-turn-helix transcriptional regulator [Fulvivirga marina]